KWLYERGLVDKKRVDRKELGRRRGATPVYYRLTGEGKAALRLLEVPPHEHVEFIAYEPGKGVRIRLRRLDDMSLSTADLDYLIKLMCGKISLLTEPPPFDVVIDVERVTVGSRLSGAICRMVEYSRKALSSELEGSRNRKRILDRIFPSPLACAPIYLHAGAEEATATEAYQRHWRGVLGDRGRMETVLEMLRPFLKGKGAAEVRGWIKDRLEETCNYFMPSPLWAKLGFKTRREFRGEVMFPYTTVLVEPRMVPLPRIQTLSSSPPRTGEKREDKKLLSVRSSPMSSSAYSSASLFLSAGTKRK
ncbi:MAG: hypothetical protein QXR87_07795, partial [Candidatus Hadarchaeales archaeon]